MVATFWIGGAATRPADWAMPAKDRRTSGASSIWRRVVPAAITNSFFFLFMPVRPATPFRLIT